MNRDRMVLLLDVLARVERDEAVVLPHTDVAGELIDAPEETRRLGFNMTSWFCGTAGCAAGHLCLDPRARALGLRLERHFVQLVPHYKGTINYDALAAFLEIDYLDADYLFCPYGYLEPDPTSDVVWHNGDARLAAYRAIAPGQVAERVREIMARERQEAERIYNQLME